MYLVFMDGCEVPAPARSGLGAIRAIGGILVPEGEVAGFDSDLRRIRREAGLAPGERLDWSTDGRQRGGCQVQPANDRDRRLHVHTTVLAAAMRRDVRSVVVVADQDVAGRDDVVRTFLGGVAAYLQDRDEIAVVVADPVDEDLTSAARDLAEVRPAEGPYPAETRIVLPVLSAPARQVPHLQVANLVVGATAAVVAGQPLGAPLAPLLSRLMARRTAGGMRSPQSTAGGVGLVLEPPRYNLLNWAFGERWHYDTEQRQLVQLPHRDWDYARSDGLPTRPHQTVA
ncbi:hypothetical protein [Fodinicola acaciae]|uniref:hypothetical protein n=1 Tax=Fodinicola acaciae TaxID=2681555 RepID=UPI0013D40B5B|nr:hypothetical protein [Fodinicola acaciae]